MYMNVCMTLYSKDIDLFYDCDISIRRNNKADFFHLPKKVEKEDT